MHWKTLLTLFFFLGSLLLVQVMDADAARFGGGKSFGSKPSMSQSAPAGSLGSKSPMAGSAATAAAKKPGFLGGMGGMLGGLLAGTLLGSLLFGGGFSGGGFMDILLIGILLFIAYKIFTRFRGAQQPTPAAASAGGAYAPPPPPREEPTTMQRQDAAPGWGALQSNPATPAADTMSVPEGFDTEEFLRGAKMAFTRLQASWDRRDLQDIAQFTSPSVLEEARSQFAQDPNPGKTEILLVNARLTGVTEDAQGQTATVYFDVLLREAPATESSQVREIWHFTRGLTSNQSWKLDGIQQVE